jgi:hypothetical protein
LLPSKRSIATKLRPRYGGRNGPNHSTRKTTGPFTAVYGYCFAGIAANEMLDIVQAESYLRRAHQLARRSGGNGSHATRLAGALLGDLLYEQGHLDEARLSSYSTRASNSERKAARSMSCSRPSAPNPELRPYVATSTLPLGDSTKELTSPRRSPCRDYPRESTTSASEWVSIGGNTATNPANK